MFSVLLLTLVASAFADDYVPAPDIQLRGPTVSPAEFCRRCIEERNGVGYYEDPYDCGSYLQCDIDDDGTVFAHKKPCAEGTLFDRNVVTCVPCEVATCDGSKAPSPQCPPRTPPPTTTMGYTTLPQFDGKCDGPDGWTYLAVWGDAHVFYRQQTLGDDTRIERVSCGPWEFSVSTCMCVVPDLQAIGLWPFDENTDTIVDNFWTDCTGVEISSGKVGGSAHFNGSVHCEVPRFNNYPWGSALTISFWYDTHGGERRQGLLGNGNCQIEPTITFWSEYSKLGGRVLIDNNGTLETVNIDGYGAAGWNHVALTYDGLRLKLYVNGAAVMDSIAVGSIPATLAPLYMGRDLNCEYTDGFSNTGLVGFIDEVQIYDWALSDAMIARLNAGERNLKMARVD
ncbi:uncharacterized protein LOC106160730 [Lingula anatina]|uniref:Uncharacterized protein LOC106160730 n=1 Tax=Lingula anatina TaxID=7574 RepID=A0A1S3I3L0_LINAN|nr:uncharacterized protein LOC106160730 [Lingula anatina]|eukprot:XP_013392852.1 uncharacterized protein LOC106160730 [Lingula anatina]